MKKFHTIVQLLIRKVDTIYEFWTDFWFEEIYGKSSSKKKDKKSECWENGKKRSIKSYIISASVLIIWLVLIFYPLYHPFYLSRIICNIGILGCGWSIILWSYKYVRNNIARLVFFVVVSFIGILMYGIFDSCESQPKKMVCVSIIECVNDVNNTLSSFFPSRGDTDLKHLKKYELDVSQTEEQNKNKLKKEEKTPVIDKPKEESESKNSSRTEFEINFYVIYHSLAYLAFGIMTMSLWGRRLVNHYKCITTLDKNKYVFWGQELDERCLILGEDIYKKCLHSEVIVSLFDNRIANYIDENRLYDSLYKKHFILRIYNENQFPLNNLFAFHHFFISDDEAWNIKGCMTLIDERRTYGITGSVDIYIRLGEGEKCVIFEDFLNTLSNNPDIRLHVFNESEIIGRDFIKNHPILLAPAIKNKIDYKTAKLKEGAQLHILLLGFGWQGRQLLSQIVASSQFLTVGQNEYKSPLFVDIIEKQRNNFSQYQKIREIACDKYHLSFYECDAFSESFVKWLEGRNRLLMYDRIIISFGDDDLNLEAFALMQKLNKIYAPERELEIYVKQNLLLFDQVNKNYEPLNKSVFGIMSSVYTKDMILDESIDVMAKYLHYIYKLRYDNTTEFDNKKSFMENIDYILENDQEYFGVNNIILDNVNREWQSIELYKKQSTRAQAEGLRNLLYLLGYEIMEKNDNQDLINELKSKIIENDTIKSILAETEHMRWEAYMLMLGIKPWIIDEYTTKNEASINNYEAKQVKEKYRHGALVDFNHLPIVDAILEILEKKISDSDASCHSSSINIGNIPLKTPSTLQIYDYNINLLPIILKKAGIRIKKLESKTN